MIGVAVLSALGAWGIRARAAASAVPTFQASRDESDAAGTGSSAAWWYALGTLGVAVVALVVALIRRDRRRRKDPEFIYANEWRPSRWAVAVTLALLGLIVAALVMVVVMISRASSTPPAAPVAPSDGVITPIPTPIPPVTGSFPSWAVVLLVVAAAVLLAGVTLGVRVLIRRRSPGGSTVTIESPRTPGAPPSAVPLAPESDDPRARVLARYHDFESSIQQAGIEVLPSDTSGEIADRATSREPGIAEPVSGLTALFRRARYSAAPVAPVDADAAERLARRAIPTPGERS